MNNENGMPHVELTVFVQQMKHVMQTAMVDYEGQISKLIREKLDKEVTAEKVQKHVADRVKWETEKVISNTVERAVADGLTDALYPYVRGYAAEMGRTLSTKAFLIDREELVKDVSASEEKLHAIIDTAVALERTRKLSTDADKMERQAYRIIKRLVAWREEQKK